MVNYFCNKCNKNFKQKAQWEYHMYNKKFPCVQKINNNLGADGSNISNGSKILANCEKKINESNLNNLNIETENDECELNKKKITTCRFCLKSFLYIKNLNKHIREERCAVIKLQKKQKENIFINLIEEEKIVNQTKKEFEKNPKKNIDKINQMDFLIRQIELLNDKLEKQKLEKETEKKQIEEKLKIMNKKQIELEKNNIELKKTNEKLQHKVNKIVNKNKINNIQNITNNTIINNNGVKLVNFGSEDLDKISYNVFINTVKSQGPGLYNKAIDGIYFNKDHPENQNIYISDFNRDKVMIYKDEKWFLDNWDNIYPILLDKVIQFGYDKEQFLRDCDYTSDGRKFNKQMIKNAMRWYKLLDIDAPDIEYFELDEDNRPSIDEETYNDYLEMQEFRKKHPQKSTEINIRNKIKLNIYNKREIPINNWRILGDSIISKKILL